MSLQAPKTSPASPPVKHGGDMDPNEVKLRLRREQQNAASTAHIAGSPSGNNPRMRLMAATWIRMRIIFAICVHPKHQARLLLQQGHRGPMALVSRMGASQRRRLRYTQHNMDLPQTQSGRHILPRMGQTILGVLSHRRVLLPVNAFQSDMSSRRTVPNPTYYLR